MVEGEMHVIDVRFRITVRTDTPGDPSKLTTSDLANRVALAIAGHSDAAGIASSAKLDTVRVPTCAVEDGRMEDYARAHAVYTVDA